MIQKPYDISIKGSTIDANKSNTIKWKVTGAMPVAFSISILNNADNTTAFTVAKTTSANVEYTLAASSLLNNKEYKIQITVWDNANNTATNDAEIFQTSSTPVVTINPTGIVGTQAYTFTATYSQAESVGIRSWIAILYDASNNLLQQSAISTSPTLSQLFDGLQSEKFYHIEFQATSNKGLVGTTGLVQFQAYYAQPNIAINLTATNYTDASVQLQWFVSQIIGSSQNTSYIGGEKIDTRLGKAWFDSGFTVKNDFTLKIWLEGVPQLIISATSEFVRSTSAPSNLNSLWLPTIIATEGEHISFVQSANPPASTSNVWIPNASQVGEQVFGITIDTTTPQTSVLWANNDLRSNNHLLKLKGDNGELTIEYVNGNFNLYKLENNTKTLMSSVAVSGTSYYLYIQQIGVNFYNLHAEVVT